MDTTAIQWRVGGRGRLQAATAIGEQQFRVTVQAPEFPQLCQCRIGQRHQTVLVTLGIADVNALAFGIDVADLQSQPLAEAQAEAVERKEKDSITAHPGGEQKFTNLLDSDDIRQALRLRCFDQIQIDPRLVQHMDVEELQTVEVEFGRRPMMSVQQVGEIVE